MFKALATAALLLSTTACVGAVRHLAKEANRSDLQSRAQHRFPIGTPVADARAALEHDGYRCLELPGNEKVKPHVSCWPTRRTQFIEKFLIGGNWRYDLYGADDRLVRLHIASARHGMRRRTASAVAPPAVPADPRP